MFIVNKFDGMFLTKKNKNRIKKLIRALCAPPMAYRVKVKEICLNFGPRNYIGCRNKDTQIFKYISIFVNYSYSGQVCNRNDNIQVCIT